MHDTAWLMINRLYMYLAHPKGARRAVGLFRSDAPVAIQGVTYGVTAGMERLRAPHAGPRTILSLSVQRVRRRNLDPSPPSFRIRIHPDGY